MQKAQLRVSYSRHVYNTHTHQQLSITTTEQRSEIGPLDLLSRTLKVANRTAIAILLSGGIAILLAALAVYTPPLGMSSRSHDLSPSFRLNMSNNGYRSVAYFVNWSEALSQGRDRALYLYLCTIGQSMAETITRKTCRQTSSRIFYMHLQTSGPSLAKCMSLDVY